MELVVRPLDRTVSIESGANLLETLRDHEIPISYSCMAGRCGTCRCRVIEGQVLESGREAKLTSLDDGRYVLACMSVLTETCIIEVPEPDEVVTHPARVLKATVVAIDDMTHDIKRLKLRPNKPLSFSPGQYAMLQFAPNHIRPYSMAGLPTDEFLEFHVRRVPEGRVTGYIAQNLQVGDAVRISGPLGTAYLRTRHPGPMLCVAGGTGLAPVLSIVRGALAAGMKNDIHVYFGVRTLRDMYCDQALTALAEAHPTLRVHRIVAQGPYENDQRGGLVTDAVAQDWNRLDGWKAYLCGAPPMVEAATLLVRGKGIEADHIHADAFYDAGE